MNHIVIATLRQPQKDWANAATLAQSEVSRPSDLSGRITDRRNTMDNCTHSVSQFLHWLHYRSRLSAARLYRRQDEIARRHGWDIVVTHRGWGRTYRDPRLAHRATTGLSALDATAEDDLLRLMVTELSSSFRSIGW
ncbi:hypothetical protein [Cryptosporangium phraense]|uniref:Uncharacterized protein n=1 Tax=Cryptosporangium phraense TaxID=2593070 RepID=A0A545AFP9_9ACTN|nr:hypothetical protein [Cryptosporangium phraense]TQS40162.1 hypothetical protein FL583_36160 [Cryptosporangium phraense]